jgi:hypothetical protein
MSPGLGTFAQGIMFWWFDLGTFAQELLLGSFGLASLAWKC